MLYTHYIHVIYTYYREDSPRRSPLPGRMLEIPSTAPKEMQQLIRGCWTSDYKARSGGHHGVEKVSYPLVMTNMGLSENVGYITPITMIYGTYNYS